MMKIAINKKLAYPLWAVSMISAFVSIYIIRVTHSVSLLSYEYWYLFLFYSYEDLYDNYFYWNFYWRDTDNIYIYLTLLTVCALVSRLLLGYTILQDKNDKFTKISVILVAIFNFNLNVLIAIIMRLVLRKNNSEKVRNAWFVPAIVSGVFILIWIIRSFGFEVNDFSLASIFTTLVPNVVYYLIFDYWFIKHLKVNYFGTF